MNQKAATSMLQINSSIYCFISSLTNQQIDKLANWQIDKLIN